MSFLQNNYKFSRYLVLQKMSIVSAPSPSRPQNVDSLVDSLPKNRVGKGKTSKFLCNGELGQKTTLTKWWRLTLSIMLCPYLEPYDNVITGMLHFFGILSINPYPQSNLETNSDWGIFYRISGHYSSRPPKS